MEESEQRHAIELRRSIADVLKKLEDHMADDTKIQGEIRLDVRSLMDIRAYDEKQRSARLTVIIALSSLIGAASLKLLDYLVHR